MTDALVDALFAVPALTISRARHLLGVSHRAAALTVARLVTAGLLTEVNRSGRTRLFLASGILQVINAEPR